MNYQNQWFEYLKSVRLDEMATRASKEGVSLPSMLEELEPYIAEPATHFFTYTSDLRRPDRKSNMPKSPATPKFGINPGSSYNTPTGIYSYPLTRSMFNKIRSGTIPFASDSQFVTLFKVKPGVKVLSNWDQEYQEIFNQDGRAAARQAVNSDDRYREIALSDEEYEEMLTTMFSPEFLEKVVSKKKRDSWDPFDQAGYGALLTMADDTRKTKELASGDAFYKFMWKSISDQSESYMPSLFNKMIGLIGSPTYKKDSQQWDDVDTALDLAFVDYLKNMIMALPVMMEDGVRRTLRWTRSAEGRQKFSDDYKYNTSKILQNYRDKTEALTRGQEDFAAIEPLSSVEIDFVVYQYAQWCLSARKMYGEDWLSLAQVTTGESDRSDPLNSEIVKDAERKSVQTQTNLGKLWNVTRTAAADNSMRWARLLRNLGIGGVVDYNSPVEGTHRGNYGQTGFGLLHSAEPEQAVFFRSTDLEVVKTFENKMTPEKVSSSMQNELVGLFFDVMNDEFVTKFGKPMDSFDTTLYRDHMRYLTQAFKQHSLEGSEMEEERKNISDALKFKDSQFTLKVMHSLGWLLHAEPIALRALNTKNKELYNTIDRINSEIEYFISAKKPTDQGDRVLNLDKVRKSLMNVNKVQGVLPRIGSKEKSFSKYGMYFGDVKITPSESELSLARSEIDNQARIYRELVAVFQNNYSFYVKYTPGTEKAKFRTVAEKHGIVASEPDVQIDIISDPYQPPVQQVLPTFAAISGGYIKENTLDHELDEYFSILQEEKGRSFARGIYRFFCMIGYTVEVGDKQRGLDDILQDLRAVENVAIVTVIEGNRRIADRKYIAGIAIKFIPSVPGKVGVPQQIKNRIIGDLRRLKNVERIFRISAGLERIE